MYSMGDTSSSESHHEWTFRRVEWSFSQPDYGIEARSPGRIWLATTGTTADGHPIVNYSAVYPVAIFISMHYDLQLLPDPEDAG